MTLALNLDLPDGTPTAGTCRVDRVNVHVAAEPTE
jgi:hypothetical protein